MENSVYAVISPEGCASIMWRDPTKKELAAQAMRITAEDLKELGCIDDIVAEPEGGAHLDHEAAALLIDAALQKHGPPSVTSLKPSDASLTCPDSSIRRRR